MKVKAEDSGDAVLISTVWKSRTRRWTLRADGNKWMLVRRSASGSGHPVTLPGGRAISNLYTVYKVHAKALIKQARQAKSGSLEEIPAELRDDLTTRGDELLLCGRRVHSEDGVPIRLAELPRCSPSELALGLTAAFLRSSPDSIRKSLQKYRKRRKERGTNTH